YIGYSQNPHKRLLDHNSGRSRYTRKKTPWRLVYTEKYSNKTEALVRERFLKRQRNKAFYLKLITDKK
ncbi:MAG: GIY-YIG nuclease family protein, partial [Bacteroidales bacterium]|nr:GIY-YIG nuclease family protein [Bacteroidales bacterium]